MKNSIFGAICGCALVPVLAYAQLTPSQIFRNASRSIVVMEANGDDGKLVAQGSGVVIAPGVVISNCHVFKDASTATVRYDQRRFPALRLHSDRERDLCSFSITGLTAAPVNMGSTAPIEVGDRAYAIGAPQGFELSLSDGLISSLRPVDGGRMLQITVPISPGSSGGGLFDSEGRLIGITTLYLKESQQVNFAVPVEWVRELPRRQSKGAAQPSLREHAQKESPTSQFEADAAAVAADAANMAAAAAVTAEEGLAQISALGEDLRRRDPDYLGKLAAIAPYVDSMVAANVPPSKWREKVESAYLNLTQDQTNYGWAKGAISPQEKKDWTSLKDYAVKWTQAQPGNVNAWLALGDAYNGSSAELNEQSRDILLEGKRSSNYNYKSQLYDKATSVGAESDRRLEKAAGYYKKAVAIDSMNGVAWYNLGFAYIQQNKTSEALAVYRVLRNIDSVRAEQLLAIMGL